MEKQLDPFLFVFSKREGPWETQICSYSRERTTHGPPDLLVGAWISTWICGREGKQDEGNYYGVIYGRISALGAQSPNFRTGQD